MAIVLKLEVVLFYNATPPVYGRLARALPKRLILT
jgi:hypothetical protein